MHAMVLTDVKVRVQAQIGYGQSCVKDEAWESSGNIRVDWENIRVGGWRIVTHNGVAFVY